ncbi:MAG: purine-nucleoside phosphorylase, partial [Gemmatimonadota bacterium]
EARFPDMTEPYDAGLRDTARAVARELGIELADGVYAAVLGQSYETPAEVRMLERLGADAVGMSTVPEVIVARALGLRVLGLALVTNAAAGITGAPLEHDDVLDASTEAATRFQALVRGVVGRIG